MKEYNATLIDYGEGKGDLVVHVGEGHPDVVFIVKAFTNMFVDLERPHGEWGEWDESNGYPCSNCGEYLPYSEEYDYQPDFCPNCGADMRKEGDENG